MKETFGYRVGAVQSMDGFDQCLAVSHKTLKKALKQLSTDYPDQHIRVGMFRSGSKGVLALQPEHPTPPDQWMIVAPVVEE